MFIYKITNIINNKCYIGLTTQVNPKIRLHRHISNAKLNVEGPLYNAIRKYGKENFTFEILIQTNNLENLNYLEQYFVNYFKTTKKQFGYNIRSGGLYFKQSEESKQKGSNTIKEQFKNGRKKPHQSSFFKCGNIPWNKGKTGTRVVSKEECILISKRLTGRKLSQTTKDKLSIAQSNFQKNNINKQSKTVLCLDTGEIFSSAAKASLAFNFPITAVSRVCNGKRKAYKGFKFVYITTNSKEKVNGTNSSIK